MINFRKKLLGTLLALTIMGILFATSSELVGAPVPGGPGLLSIGSYEFKPFPPDTLFAFQNSRLSTPEVELVFFSRRHIYPMEQLLLNWSFILLIMGQAV